MDQGKFFEGLDGLFQTKNIEEIEKYILHGMEEAQKEGDVPAMLAIANELGGIYRVTNRFHEAKKIYGVANEAIKILGLENTVQQGTTLLNLASVYNDGNEPEEALKTYENVAHIYERKGLAQDYRMAALYNNMSHAYEQLGLQDEAIRYAEKSVAVIKALPDHKVELATSYTTLGTRYLKKGNHEEAWRHLKEGERIFTSLPGRLNVHYAATLNALGDLYFCQKKLYESADCFTKSLAIIKDNYGENKGYEQVTKNLSKVQEQLKNESGIHGPQGRLKGMELAQGYFHEYGKEMIDKHFSEHKEFMAMGLVGEGSECLGYDDEDSESHDFGPGFCIWVPESIFNKIGPKLQGFYNDLPKTFQGKRRMETLEGRGRVGVFSIEEFYKKYIGHPHGPKNNVEWLFIPETSLRTVTNGKVFEDYLGEFSKIRKDLLDFYPRDVYLKKIVARMALMSQTGQYNYQRSMKRKDYGAAYLACSEFVKATVSMVYLLNYEYMPFYKWMFRGMDQLMILKDIKGLLEKLLSMQDIDGNAEKKVALIEETCIQVRDELARQNIIVGTDAFLNSHCHQVMSLIADPQIRNLPVMFDGK